MVRIDHHLGSIVLLHAVHEVPGTLECCLQRPSGHAEAAVDEQHGIERDLTAGKGHQLLRLTRILNAEVTGLKIQPSIPTSIRHGDKELLQVELHGFVDDHGGCQLLDFR